MLALYLFGPPKLELDGALVHIPRRKATALLAYLAVSGQSHSRDVLATLLWPENDQSSARAELRRTLSVLNRVLGEGWLQADRETVSWAPDPGNPFWLDAADFEGKLKICESHNHPATAACPECLPTLGEATELYTDDFMAGFSLKDCREYDEWQFFETDKLRSQLANVLVRLCSFYESARDYETAIQFARRYLALDPLQEAAHRQLMSLFWQSEQRAASLRQYEQCRQTLKDELGVEPSEEIRELYQRIKTSSLVTPAALRPKSNLPVQTTPFIGRERELAEIRAKLKEDDCRLLTLLGPGGSGKTRLAIEATGGLLDDFKQGVFFVNLAPLEDPARLPATIAAALNFSFYEEGTPEAQLLDYLGNKELLLILDSFEHILAGVNYVSQILKDAPKVKILATSRSRLLVTGEHLFDVWGMAYPDIPVSLEIAVQQFSAVKLFESQARRVQGNFQLNNENLGDVIQVCGLVEGMPLGIVLAASWANMLSPKEIAVEISHDLAFLEKELQDLPERQRGMRGVFNHSWRLLSEREQEILAALSVFRGGFTREAAQAVAGASLNDLMGLIDKSILHRVADGRFEVHELLRQYAAEKLEIDPDLEDRIRDKHSNYFCQALANWESDLEGPRQGVAQAEMVKEIDNIRTAWTWAVEKARLSKLHDAINALCHFYNGQYLRVEAVKICLSLVEQLDAFQSPNKSKYPIGDTDLNYHIEIQKLKVRALSWGGYFNWVLGNLEQARELSVRGLSLINSDFLSTQDLRFDKGVCLHNLAYTKQFISQVEAIKLVEESIESFRSIHNYWWLGLLLGVAGEFSSSNRLRVKYFEESLEVSRKYGNLTGIARALSYLSLIAAHTEQFERAEQMLVEALMIYKEIPLQIGIVNSYRLLGSYLVWQGKFVQARSIEREMLDIHLNYGSSHSEAFANAIAGYPDLSLGDYNKAYDQAKYGLSLCKKENHRFAIYGIVYAISILGRVAQVRKNYKEAEEWFQECIPIYQTLGEHYNVGQDLASMGHIARETGQIPQARDYLLASLQIALEENAFLPLNHALPGIALLFADQGEVERAVELYALACTQGYVANSKWFDDIAGDEIARVAQGLPVDVAEAAKARGRGLDLWGTAAALLEELDELGWGDRSDVDQLSISAE